MAKQSKQGLADGRPTCKNRSAHLVYEDFEPLFTKRQQAQQLCYLPLARSAKRSSR